MAVKTEMAIHGDQNSWGKIFTSMTPRIPRFMILKDEMKSGNLSPGGKRPGKAMTLKRTSTKQGSPIRRAFP